MPTLKHSGRVEYVAATDEEAVQALLLLSKTEESSLQLKAHMLSLKQSNAHQN